MVGTMSALSRRNFVAGTGAIAGAGALAAFPSYQALAAEAAGQEGAQDAAPYADRASAELDADVVVVGAGISGLAAAVQAGELGAKVVLLETGTTLGGNGQGTEGMFGVNSRLQQEQGITITFAEIINEELDFFAYKIDPSFWRDLYDYSGGNLDWLQDNGVKFSGVVDNYGVGRVETFHWYDGTAVECYIEPMKAKADEYGVQTLLETRGRELIQDADGTVDGIYAEGTDGTVTRINAGAVILATGGFAGSPEEMKRHGIVLGNALLNGSTTNVGDGLEMAVAAGAYDRSYEACYLSNAMTPGFTFFLSLRIGMLNTGLWVNLDGVRYTNENCGARVQANAANALRTQFGSYLIVTEKIVDDAAASSTFDGFDFKGELEKLVAEGAEGIYEADTLDELAEAAGIEPVQFAETVERYNGYCATGVDEDFSKEAEYLVPIDEGPFYAIKQMDCFGTSMGAILVNRNYQALTIDHEPIPGLYAVGTDGCMMYYGTYTIEVPSSIGGHNVNSARLAARHAVASLG